MPRTIIYQGSIITKVLHYIVLYTNKLRTLLLYGSMALLFSCFCYLWWLCMAINVSVAGRPGSSEITS